MKKNEKVENLSSKDSNQKFEEKQECKVGQLVVVKQRSEEGVKEVV
ncbi:hypothetical protein QIA36_05720 (plasmid) [Borreliella yangtzensis]